MFDVCEPDELLATTLRHAEVLAATPISSLVESERLITAPWREPTDAAGENAAFPKLMAGPANAAVLRAFAEKRAPDSRTCRPVW